MLNESAKIKKAIERVADAEINKLTAPCYRTYKAIVTEAPNGATCKVRLIGDDTELTLPYAEKLSGIKEGAYVWVGAFYATDKSLSNAVVWETLKFGEPNGSTSYSYVETGATSTSGGLNIPVDTSKFRILQITLVNNDLNSGMISESAIFIYGGDNMLYKYGVSGTYASVSAAVSPANSCDIDFGAGTTWSDNNNMTISVLYAIKQ